jgi:hypothetical protein
MSWTPAPTVTIDGVDYTGETLETIRIDRGREEVFQEPRASYAVCELIDLTGNGLDVDVLQTVQIAVDDSNGQPVNVFTGTVTDWAATLYDIGEVSDTPASIVTIIAIGALGVLNRRNVAPSGLPAQLDGDRIFELVEQAVAISWEETPGTWATAFEPTTTWEQVDPQWDPNRIDRPGVFDIAALDPTDEGYNPLTEGYLTAFSGRGVLFDDADGFIVYQDADHRELAAIADGYLEADARLAVARQMTTTSSASDIVNRVGVVFPSGSALFDDGESILTYGVLAREFETNLADPAAALAWALDYLEDHAGPIVNFRQISYRLDGLADDTFRDALLTLDCGSPVVIENLPATLGVTQLPAFVEGVTWRINRQTAELRLNVSDAALSIGSIRWNLVAPNLEWGQVAATLTWQDARRL